MEEKKEEFVYSAYVRDRKTKKFKTLENEDYTTDLKTTKKQLNRYYVVKVLCRAEDFTIAMMKYNNKEFAKFNKKYSI